MGIPLHVVDYRGVANDPDFETFIATLGDIDLTNAQLNTSYSYALGTTSSSSSFETADMYRLE